MAGREWLWQAAGMTLMLFAGATAPAAEMVREDWYFRESLAAIHDWEQILERWQRSVPEDQRTPRFPVSVGGQAVTWPNPIPSNLMPAADRSKQVQLRLVGDRVEVVRSSPGGKTVSEKIATGRDVVAYRHPGGGGKDQWYHVYSRHFDRLTACRVQPAPFALAADPPPDFRRGRNELAITLRNTGDRPLDVACQVDLHLPAASQPCGRRSLHLAPGESQSARFPVELRAEGGGLVVLAIEAGGSRYWTSWATHVENVTAVLASIEQILADDPVPSPCHLDHLAWKQLREIAAGWRPEDGGWSSVFEEACKRRDELLLENIGWKFPYVSGCHFGAMLLIQRKPFFSEQPFMDAHHLYNRPGGGIYRLEPPGPGSKLTPVVDSLGEGVYRDVCLHWDAQRLLFAFGNGSDAWDGKQSYHIYEVNVDGTGLRQITTGPKNDCEPFYLPDGRIGFTSDRSEHFVMCGGDRHAPNLYAVRPDGTGLCQLSYNVFNDFTPSMLPDGRILYSRWEYNERSVTSLHHPFTMNPDGTMVAPYYGNATIRPNVVMFPRAVPGSSKVMALFTAHHGQTHGAVGLIDVRRGVDGPAALELLTPGVPVTGERAEDSRRGWFSDPQPLTEKTWLCSYTPTVVPWHEATWGLYVADRHGNLALLYRDPQISCAEPVPLLPRPRPHALPPRAAQWEAAQGEATLALADVYEGLSGVPRGTAKHLRLLEDVPRKGVHSGGVVCTSGTSIYTIKRVLGTVPIEQDGSAQFVVPANRNVYFEVLDGEYREIQRMRSVVCLRPGESRSCVGCHEPRSTAPPWAVSGPVRQALMHAPRRPAPPPWGQEILSFLRDVQPVLNAQCIACHTHDRATNRVILTDDLTDQFCIGYEELLPYLSVASAMRWDNPEDVHARPPYTYGSRASRLSRLLDAGHHGVKLSEEQWQRLASWIDANGVYYDRYEMEHWPDRRIFVGAPRKAIEEVLVRRCAKCHSDWRQDTWAASLNRRDVKQSRALAAPLARSAGGWGRCEGPVFASTDDPDYRTLLGALAAIRDALAKKPREDLASLRGTPAETQPVTLPAPPAARQEEALPKGDWVSLSDLAWESGRAGWSRNQDGLPRRDLDSEDHPLRLGSRRYRKGIGTHAGSEIVYLLDGRYQRFVSDIGGAERHGTVVFQVFADDRRLFESGVMRGQEAVKTVDVPVANVRRLRLVVTDAGDGIAHDMANWAGARLLKAGK